MDTAEYDIVEAARSVLDLPAWQRVRNGARWLDENFPGWEDRIDLDELELSSGESCICGQVFAKDAEQEVEEADAFVSGDGSGYSYASRHLFYQANSCINTFVALEVDPTLVTPEDHRTFWDDAPTYARNRANLVAVALGFYSLYSPSDGFYDLTNDQKEAIGEMIDSDNVTYYDLQKEWVEELATRTGEYPTDMED